MIKLLTVKEVSKLFKTSEEHVRNIIRRGDSRAYKEGRKGGYRILEADVHRYLSEKLKIDPKKLDNAGNNMTLLVTDQFCKTLKPKADDDQN